MTKLSHDWLAVDIHGAESSKTPRTRERVATFQHRVLMDASRSIGVRTRAGWGLPA